MDEAAPSVLVLAPTGRDAQAVTALLNRAGINTRICEDIAVVCERLDDSVDAVLLAEEGLTSEAQTLLSSVTLVSAVRAAQRSRKRQYQLRDHIRERERTTDQLRWLVNELNHRVKNTLATIQSIAAQTLKEASTETRDAFEARLIALSKTHDLLTQTKWQGAQLRDVLLSELMPYSGHYFIEGPEVTLNSRAALAPGMTFHELATNAAKYGALSSAAGLVTVRWQLSATAHGEALRLSWTESGGPPVAQPLKRGFGSRLIQRGLTYELNAEVRIDFAATGLLFTFDAPIGRCEVSSDGSN